LPDRKGYAMLAWLLLVVRHRADAQGDALADIASAARICTEIQATLLHGLRQG